MWNASIDRDPDWTKRLEPGKRGRTSEGARHGRTRDLVLGVLVSFGSIAWSGPAHAEEPAVRALNGRVGMTYDWGHVDEQRFGFFPGPTAVFFEVEEQQVGPYGALTIPIAQRVGLRAGVDARYLSVDRDLGGSDDGGGVALETEVFVRDPEHYELGAGLQYAYQEISNDELHGLRGTLQGKLFLADRGAWWPALDLDLSGSFGAADVEDSGDDERLVHAVAGGLRIYSADRVALRLGGRYEHLEIQDGWRVETSVARVDLSVLILRTPALTLGPRFEGGDVRTEFVLFPHFQRSFYSAGVYVSLSFPGAESLVVLNRNYY